MNVMMEDSVADSIESDDNFDDLPKINPYEKKYYALLRRCEAIQQSNERLVNRIQHVRRLVGKLQRERRFFMKRLDRHNDNYRNISLSYGIDFKEVPIKQEPGLESSMSVTSHLSQLLLQKKAKLQGSSFVTHSAAEKSENTTKPPVKRKIKHEKTERDRNAPKRPANPFLLFCQDQRANVLGKMQKETKEDVTHQELTKGLAQSWNGLNPDDKKIYYNMYEKEKERYEKEMQVYTSAANNSSATSSASSVNSVIGPSVNAIKTEPPDTPSV